MSKQAKKPRVRWVTARLLLKKGACSKAYSAFVSKYGHRAKVRPIDAVQACWRSNRNTWAWWLLLCLLPKNPREAWNKGCSETTVLGMRRIDYRYARMISAEAKK